MGTPLRLGLTGGIGSGKSTVATLLAACPIALIDADAISRPLTHRVASHFLPLQPNLVRALISSDGALDRDKMRELVYRCQFASAGSHRSPAGGTETSAQAEQAMRSSGDCIVFDIPLLVESAHWRNMLTTCWWSTAPQRPKLSG